MNLSPLLDTALGLVLILLILSSVGSALGELLTNTLQDRAFILRRAIRSLLLDDRPAPLPLRYRFFSTLAPDKLRRALGWLNEPSAWVPRFARSWVKRAGRFAGWVYGGAPYPTPADPSAHPVLQRFWRHARIAPLCPHNRIGPSYMPPDAFSEACTALVLGDKADQIDHDTLITTLEQRATDPRWGLLAPQMLELAQARRAAGSSDPFSVCVRKWFEQRMQRISGEFRRRVGLRLFWIGLLCALTLNVDLIRIGHTLYTQPQLRAFTADLAVETFKEGKRPEDSKELNKAAASDPEAFKKAQKAVLQERIDTLESLGLAGIPVGWDPEPAANYLPASKRRMPGNPEHQKPLNSVSGKTRPGQAPPASPSAGGEHDLLDYAPQNSLEWLQKSLALLLAGLAVSVGAPFWFDLLGRLVSLRTSGGRPSDKTTPAADKSEASASTQTSATSGASSTAGAAGGVGAGSWLQGSTFALANAAERLREPLPERLEKTPASKHAWDNPEADLFAPASQDRETTTARTWWLAHLANLSYEDDAAQRSSPLLKCSEAELLSATALSEGDSLLAKLRKRGLPDTQVLVAHFPPSAPGRGTRLLLAFRGTEGSKPSDIITDASFKPEVFRAAKAVSEPAQTPLAAAGKVHSGFQAALDVVWPQLVPHLTRAEEVVITGHSLGGALAVLAAARLCHAGPRLVALTTFGCPRAGDSQFVSWLESRLPAHAALRVVNDLDIVTRVPFRTLGYAHLNQVLFFGPDGTGHFESQSWSRFLNTLRHVVDDYAASTKEAVHDHSMNGYENNCAKLAGRDNTSPA